MGELAFARFGERGTGELIMARQVAGRFREDEDDGKAGVEEGNAWEVRWRVGGDIDASISET